MTVEPGTLHSFRNVGTEEARFLTEITPALGFERFIETMYGLAADGKTNRKGLPNPLRLAVIMRRHFDLVRLTFPPVFLQRTGLALGHRSACWSATAPRTRRRRRPRRLTGRPHGRTASATSASPGISRPAGVS